MEDITLDEDAEGLNSDGLTESMKSNLKDAFNWMRVVAFISLGMFGLMIIIWIRALSQLPSFAMGQMGGPMVFLLLIVVGEILLILTLLKAGNAYKAYTESGSRSDLEMAFKKQKQFWLATGIIAIIGAFFFLIVFAQAMSMPGYRGSIF